MQKIIIFGIGDFAELVYYYFNNSDKYEVTAFTVDSSFINFETFLGLPLVPFEKVETLYPTKMYQIFVAVGYKNVNKVRQEKYLQAKMKGYSFASYISDTAIISKSVKLGSNNLILEGVIIQPFACIGDGVILWSGSHIGHHSIVNNFCFLAPSVSLSGYVTINERSFVGNNAVIRDRVLIGAESIIGAGVSILQDTPEKSVYKSLNVEKMEITSDQLRSI